MIIRLTDNLNIETEMPVKTVIRFRYSWKINGHAELQLEGYVDRNSRWSISDLYDSRFRLFQGHDEEEQTILCGVISRIETKTEGSLEHVTLNVLSASCQLDRKLSSSSFQNPEKTYGEIIRAATELEGGSIIRNRESDKETGMPVFRYQETVWQFAGRLADRLGICIIPDVMTGRPNFWFGMRKGKAVMDLSEEQYTMDIFPIGKTRGIRYQTEGRKPLNIGDTVSYLKQTLTITGVEGNYEHGELIFKYVMEDIRNRRASRGRHTLPAGLGLWGTVKEAKGETLKIALDIDDNEETGDYFYPWQPETGNSLYAMPEPGAVVLLYFYDAEQTQGVVTHCLNKEKESPYKDRYMETADGNRIQVWEDEVGLIKGDAHSLTIGGSSISADTQKKMEISAEGSVFLRGRKIVVKTPEEIIISQG